MIVQLIDYLRSGLRSERGAGLAEYALLVMLIAMVALVAVTLAGAEVSEQYSFIASSVESA